MKKFMTLAVASILSMSAFAQDVYKQISKLKIIMKLIIF